MSRTSPMRRGFTLIELLMSVAITAVLTAGLASSLYIAAQSLDVADEGLHQTREAHRVLAAIHRDAQAATAFSELTATSVAMSVPDRNGDNVPETIRYAWSGTAGDPLTYQINGGAVETIAADVQAFNLGYLSRFIEGVSQLPRVLFVSGQYADGDGGVGTVTAAEQLRIDLIESWGYDVQTISQEATQATFDAELAEANVVFVSGQINSGTLGTKVTATSVGVVTESAYNAVQLGILGTTLYTFYQPSQTIEITDASHYIMSEHAAGALQVFDSEQQVKMHFSTADLAPATNVLATVSQALTFPTFVTVDADEEVSDGGNAAGRRVLLPWGDNGFDFTALNADGQTLLKRSVEWASGQGDESPDGLKFEEFTEAKRSSNDRDIQVDVPAGTAQGDLLIAAVAVDGNSMNITAESGWTQLHASESSGVTFGVWMRIASASEPSNYQFDWNGNEQSYGWIMRFSGQDATNPIHAVAVNTGDSSNPQAPSVTTSVDGALILRLGGFDDDDITVDDAGMAGHTTITMDETSTDRSCSGGATYQMQTASGNSGTADFTLTNGESYITVTIAIAPE